MSGPIPARVDSAAKTILLGLIDDAVKAGWALGRICGVLELDRARAWRWRHRQAVDRLDDATPGGQPIHGLLAWEEAEILAVFEEWGAVDLSHRKLAHRGSYTERVWVSPSTVDRVLARNGLALQGLPRPARSAKKPWPEWVQWRPNQLWCWDASHFSACAAAPVVYGIVDVRPGAGRWPVADHLVGRTAHARYEAGAEGLAARLPSFTSWPHAGVPMAGASWTLRWRCGNAA